MRVVRDVKEGVGCSVMPEKSRVMAAAVTDL